MLALVLTQLAYSQSDSASSPALASVKSFWKQIDKLKAMDEGSASFKSGIQLAESYQKSVKKQDPAFNTANMDKALDLQRARMPQSNNVARNNSQSEEGNRASSPKGKYDPGREAVVVEMFDSLFTRHPYTGPSGTDADDARNASELQNYRQTASRYIAMNIPPDDRAMTDGIRSSGLDTTGITENLYAMSKALRSGWEDKTIGEYDHLLAMEAYWSAAATLFHNRSDFSAAHHQVRDTLTSIGSRDNAKAMIARNKLNRGGNVSMPAAVRKDATVEQEFRTAFMNEGWNESILKINILSNEWTVVRNNVTGAITGRTQTAAIAARNQKGECILYTYTIMQEYDGSRYLPAKRYSHDATYIACANVK